MSRIKLISPLGSLLIIAGLLVPSSMLVESIRTVPPNLETQLILGGTIFKVGLVLWGLFLFIAGSLWKSKLRADTFYPSLGQTLGVVFLRFVLFHTLVMRYF